jgi:transcriptional regulator with XRE-family HTH domain
MQMTRKKGAKPAGARHTRCEDSLMKQVRAKFRRVRKKRSAREMATALGVSVPSLYNYLNGTDLPRIEILRAAEKLWKIKWKFVDATQLLAREDAKSVEQLVLPFLEGLRAEDVLVSFGHSGKSNELKITVNIAVPSIRR